MSTQWSEIVEDYAPSMAPVDANIVQLSDLSALTIVDISGEDATGFLQGQFCNDLGAVSVTQAQITGYCTPKGRLLALPTILGSPQGYRLLLPSEVAEAFIKRLSIFVMRSKVTITINEEWMGIGMTGDAGHVAELLDTGAEQLPADPMSLVTHDNEQIIRWHDDFTQATAGNRYIRLASVEQQATVWKAGESTARRPMEHWRAADISAGVPGIWQGVVDAFVPQMLNLQLINALSFTKGCYPGQEIVARMQYLGKLKRHTRLLSMSMPALDAAKDPDGAFALPAPGDPISANGDETAGVVLDAQPINEQEALVLAVMKVSANELELGLAGVPLESRALPYELPSLVLDVQASDAGA